MVAISALYPNYNDYLFPQKADGNLSVFTIIEQIIKIGEMQASKNPWSILEIKLSML